jgi:signal transduction histidine kinase
VLVLAALRDVTNRKRIEGERGELAGGVAHDFNNLLSAIMNYAGLVSERLEDQMNRLGLSENKAFVTLAQDVEEITKVAKQAAALTDQL